MHEIREGTRADLNDVLSLNQAEEKWTSELDLDSLEELMDYSVAFKVLADTESVFGFALVMNSSSAYSNANLDWFNARLESFWYVDRIVVAGTCSRKGYGRALYERIFASARLEKVRSITCEYSARPMNERSAAFHAQMGFREIGNRNDKTNGKGLSMQVCELSVQAEPAFVSG